MKITTRGRRTILVVDAADAVHEKRPHRGKWPGQIAFYARRRIEGKCYECGAARERLKWRCDKCQKRTNARDGKRKYGDEYRPTGRRKPRSGAGDEFLRDMAGWHRVGWDVAERIRRRRQFKDRKRRST